MKKKIEKQFDNEMKLFDCVFVYEDGKACHSRREKSRELPTAKGNGKQSNRFGVALGRMGAAVLLK